MIRWYGIGGDWINEGLPMYVAIDRKPENGLEIQNLCCAGSGVMMRLKLVKSAKERAREEDMDGDDEAQELHGTKVLLELLEPWASTKRRIVCADSYFASVRAAVRLDEINFGFQGPIKTATTGFPMKALGEVAFKDRGEVAALVAEVQGVDMAAVAWLDRNRYYFISTAFGIKQGTDINRRRLRQEAAVESDEAPIMQELTITQPQLTEVYYKANDSID